MKNLIGIVLLFSLNMTLAANLGGIPQLLVQVAEAQKKNISMVLMFKDGSRMLLQQPTKLNYQKDGTFKLNFMSNGKNYSRSIVDKGNVLELIGKDGKKHTITDIKKFNKSSSEKPSDNSSAEQSNNMSTKRNNCRIMGQWRKESQEALNDCDETIKNTVCMGEGECVDDPRFKTDQYKLRCFAIDGVCPDFYTCANSNSVTPLGRGKKSGGNYTPAKDKDTPSRKKRTISI